MKRATEIQPLLTQIRFLIQQLDNKHLTLKEFKKERNEAVRNWKKK